MTEPIDTEDRVSITEEMFPEPSYWQTPEARMFAALLEDAAEAIRGRHKQVATSKKNQANRADAIAWIMDDTEDTKWHFTFTAVCDVLGLDPGAVRKALIPNGTKQ